MKLFKSNLMKKLIILLLSFFTIQFSILSSKVVSAATQPKIDYSIEGNTSVGSNIKININISNANNLYGYSIDFLYNPNIIKINKITRGNILNSLIPIEVINKIDNKVGQSNIAVTLKGATSPVSANGTLAVIDATVINTGKLTLNTTSTNDELNLTKSTVRVKLSDNNAKSISYTSENKEITLTNKMGWAQSNGKWYYYNNNGKLVTGWLKDNGTWYFFNSSGVMQTGWLKNNGHWYFLNSSGAMQTGWLKNNGTWYFLDSSGVMQTGWLSNNGTWYFLNSSGVMQTGWLSNNGTWYFLNSSGVMQTGWLSNNGTWYFLNSSGAMKTGWLKDNGSWYFLNSSGAMKTGWIKDNGTWYYLYSNGKMATNTKVDGWIINSSGVARPQ